MTTPRPRPWYADTADRHADEDWRLGSKWNCTCEVCTVARGDLYEPRSSINAIRTGARLDALVAAARPRRG